MEQERLTNEYLYSTAVPVLLDGKVEAGRLAMEIYTRHGITPHWFGKGFDMNLTAYAARHPLPAPLPAISDSLLLQILLDFAHETPGLLILYPCSPKAVIFTERVSSDLESHFVIALPQTGVDPLGILIRKA